MECTQRTLVCVFLIITACIAENGASFEQIWLAPANYSNNETVSEPFSAAERGEWFTSDIAVGWRLKSALTMDSKKILWIVGGVQNATSSALGVWNYNATSDQYRWVWKPSNSSDLLNYSPGELGVESDLNSPGALTYTPITIDLADNIWIFTLRNELWMFNTSSWMWVRVQGSKDQTKVASFGANPGQPGADVWPGYTWGFAFFADSLSNLWFLNGGDGGGSTILNNVWHFNTTSNLWRFVSGDKTPPRQSSNSTYFGGLYSALCDIDDGDKVWCYSGSAYDPAGNLRTNDIWTYDTRSDTWTHVFGTFARYSLASTVVNPNDYDPGNKPSYSQGNFINRRDGTFMLISGNGGYGRGLGGLDTIWLYNVTLHQWKLVYGNISTAFTPGEYVTRREPGSTRPAVAGFAAQSGLNFDGDVFIHGGNFAITQTGPFIKDIWLIPQNQCLTTANKCDTNADCIDQLMGYSCQCKQGYQGDGFTCALPTSPEVTTPNGSTPTTATSVPSSNNPVSATSNVSRLVGSVAWILITAAMF